MTSPEAWGANERRDLTQLTNLGLAHDGVDAFDRLELAQYAWDQFKRSGIQSSARSHFPRRPSRRRTTLGYPCTSNVTVDSG